MRVKTECKNKDKKKSTQSARSARSAQSARSAVCSLQSAWSAFWGDRLKKGWQCCFSKPFLLCPLPPNNVESTENDLNA